MSDKDVILFVNLTKQCNVNCPRCYLTEDSRKEKKQLEFSVFEKLVSHPFFIDASSCTIIWEGGEATLLGERKLKAFIDLARKLLPNARQTMVTNFLNMPNWLIRMVDEEFGGRVETTYALGNKFTLDGSSSKYNDRFKRSLIKAKNAGLEVAVNIELNRETYDLGPIALVEIIEETGNKFWEFDFSVDFAKHNSIPVYNNYGYPVLEGTITNKEFSSYILRLFTDYKERMEASGVKPTIIEHMRQHFDKSLAFNVKRESEFITINPDGTVTTNPLFSDMARTYIGNIKIQSAESILNSRLIKLRADYEESRTRPCLTCKYYSYCGGGPSHVPLMDNSDECAGSYILWENFSKQDI